MRVFLLSIPLLCAAFLFAGCSDPPPQDAEPLTPEMPTKVKLQLNWYPEVEHGGYYAALVHGYFAEEELDVEILPGGPGAPVIPLVDRGAATFGVTNADDILLARAQDADVVAVIAPLQTSPRCIMVHESSGIKTLDQLSGVTLAMNSGKPFAQFLKKRVPLENVQIVDGAAVPKFLADEKYAQQAYVFSEPFVAQKQGGDPVSLLVSDLGFNPYTSVLIATTETANANSELVAKMVRASLKGWKKYLESPDETNALINKRNTEMGLDILAFGVEAMKPLCLVEGSDIGTMTDERWKTLQAQMIEIEAIKPDAVDVTKSYTLKFLE